MSGQQSPIAVQTDLSQGLQDGRPAILVQQIRRLSHLLNFRGDSFWIGFQQSATGQIVTPVYRTRFIAIQVAAVTINRDEVRHTVSLDRRLWHTLPDGRGSEVAAQISTLLESITPSRAPGSIEHLDYCR